MAITQCIPTSFKVDILSAQQNFSALSGGPNVYYMALYLSTASIGAGTSAYTASGEVPNGGGYTAGGQALSISTAPTSSGTTAFISFSNVTWAASTITARGAMIYNFTAAGKNAVAIFDFGSDKTSSSSAFTIVFPTADASNAVLRIA
jgi:hypothetical protein